MRRTGVLVALLLLAGCGGFQPSMPSLERDLRDDLAEQVGAKPAAISVECPSSIDWEVGGDFRCQAEDQRGRRVMLTVHMENDSGEYSWETN